MGGMSSSYPLMNGGCRNSAIPNCPGRGDSKWDPTVLGTFPGEMEKDRRAEQEPWLWCFLTPHLQPTGKAKGSESGQGLGFIHRTIGAAEPNLTVHGFPELRSVPFMSVNLSASLRSLPASSPVRLKGGAKQLPTARGKYSGSYRLLAA